MSQVFIDAVPPSRKRKNAAATTIQRAFKKRKTAMSVNKIPKTLREFPKEMRVTLKFAAQPQLTVPSGATGGRLFWRANSVFDPDPLVGGSSAAYFSQWSQFYTKYTVVASSISFRLLDQDTGTSGTGTLTGLFGITVVDSATPLTTPTFEQLITDADSTYRAFDSWHPDHRVTKKLNMPSYFGVKDILDNGELSGLTGTTLGSNPSKQVYYLTWAKQAPGAGAAAQAFMADVYITYDVVFSQPADL